MCVIAIFEFLANRIRVRIQYRGCLSECECMMRVEEECARYQGKPLAQIWKISKKNQVKSCLIQTYSIVCDPLTDVEVPSLSLQPLYSTNLPIWAGRRTRALPCTYLSKNSGLNAT